MSEEEGRSSLASITRGGLH
jgi:hypothetical protein